MWIELSEVLRPDAASTTTGIGAEYPVGSNHWDDVNDVTPDEDSTYVKSSSTAGITQTDLYNCPNTTNIPSNAVITDVVITVRSKYVNKNDTSEVATAILENGVTTYSSYSPVTNAYANYSTPYLTKPSNGEKWTLADIFTGNTFQFGVRHHVIGNGMGNPSDILTTKVHMVIFYRIWVPDITII